MLTMKLWTTTFITAPLPYALQQASMHSHETQLPIGSDSQTRDALFPDPLGRPFQQPVIVLTVAWPWHRRKTLESQRATGYAAAERAFELAIAFRSLT